MKLFSLALLLTTGAFEEPGTNFYQDFRNSNFAETEFDLIGRHADDLVKPEPEGLRITLSVENKQTVGVATKFNIKGDFEITTGYEIIQADPAKEGRGVSFEVYLVTDTPTKEALSFYRRIYPGDKTVYKCTRLTTNEKGDRESIQGFKPKDIPAIGKSGQLRITRIGSTAMLSVAEKDSKTFKVLYRVPLGTEDISLLRLDANPGGAANAMDLRIHDLRVRNLVPNNPDWLKASTMVNPPPSTEPWWVAGLFAALLVCGGLWVWWNKRRIDRNKREKIKLTTDGHG